MSGLRRPLELLEHFQQQLKHATDNDKEVKRKKGKIFKVFQDHSTGVTKDAPGDKERWISYSRHAKL